MAACATSPSIRPAPPQRLAVAAGSPSRRVAFSAVGDNCPLCQALDGKVFEADSADARRYTPPLHINCNCIWVEVGDDELGAADRLTPRQQELVEHLVEQHGHFVSNPEKYVALKIPAGPAGRDFTFRRGKAGERGTVEWNRPRYGLDDEFEQTGVGEVGTKWVPSRRDEFLTELPGDESPYAGRRGDRSSLGTWGENLAVSDVDDPDVANQLDELSLLPGAVAERLAAKGVTVRIGRGSVVELGADDLAGMAFRSVPGATYDEVGGLYRARTRRIYVGTTRRGYSISRPLHEVGHAIGDLYGINDSQELQEHVERLRDQLLPPFTELDDELLRRELFAEAVATVLSNREVAELLWDREFVDWVTEALLRIRP